MNEEKDEELTDEQSENVIGGVGAGTPPGYGTAGWFGGPSEGEHGLSQAGYTAPGEQFIAGESGQQITTPGEK